MHLDACPLCSRHRPLSLLVWSVTRFLAECFDWITDSPIMKPSSTSLHIHSLQSSKFVYTKSLPNTSSMESIAQLGPRR